MIRPETAVGHLDADCFYVSAERVRDPFLCGKPVGVLGNQGACVIAKSYEMKAAGVKTGEPIWEALPKCPEGVFIKRDFRWYEVLSRRMLDVMRTLSPRVEYYSIDEFFFQAVPLRQEVTMQETALEIQACVEAKVGVPITVGIARSRTLAKLISDSAKPHGARAVLDPEEEALLLASLPVSEITGIAGRREKRLLPWGIRTCLDLARADRRLIRKVLTCAGEVLWWELNGDPVQAIRPRRPLHKAISRGGSFGETTIDPRVLYAWLVRNIERLVEELHYHETRVGRLTIWVGYKNGQAGVGTLHISVPTDRFDQLLETARPCLRQAYIRGVPAQRMHVIAENLHRRDPRPLDLFEPAGRHSRAEALARVKERINQRIGRFALRSAATLPLPSIYADIANGYDICDVHGKMCF
jgi:nucleotidyltransferase/DNA polymerase involved in DNA repair